MAKIPDKSAEYLSLKSDIAAILENIKQKDAIIAASFEALETRTLKEIELAVIERKYDNWPVWMKILYNIWVYIERFFAYLIELLSKLFDAGSHYIVFFLVIGLLLYGATMFMSPPPAKPAPTSEKDKQHHDLIEAHQNLSWFQMQLDKLKNLMKPGYQILSFIRMFSKNQETLFPRERMAEGRCDNMNRMDGGAECFASTKPEDLSWTIDTDKMDNWTLLPKEFQNQNADKLNVYMPYIVQNSFYVPQCTGAYYKTASGDHKPINLYDEGGTSCNFRTVNSTLYNKNDTVRDGSGYGPLDPAI